MADVPSGPSLDSTPTMKKKCLNMYVGASRSMYVSQIISRCLNMYIGISRIMQVSQTISRCLNMYICISRIMLYQYVYRCIT
jgi:hypothetical protein